MNLTLIISNIVGLIALTFWVGSIQAKNKNKIMIIQLIANVFYAAQYILIGALSAGIMNIVSCIRYYVYYKNEEKGKNNSIALLLLFVTIIILLAVLTVKNYIDLIPIIISIWYTYITWQKNTKIMRYGFIAAAIVWIYYNLQVHAYAPFIGNILEIISGTIAVARFRNNKKNDI